MRQNRSPSLPELASTMWLEMRQLIQKSLLLVALAVVLPIALLAVLRIAAFPHPCDRIETVLVADSKGRSVTSTFEACTTLGTVTSEWVDVVSPSGRHDMGQ